MPLPAVSRKRYAIGGRCRRLSASARKKKFPLGLSNIIHYFSEKFFLLAFASFSNTSNTKPYENICQKNIRLFSFGVIFSLYKFVFGMHQRQRHSGYGRFPRRNFSSRLEDRRKQATHRDREPGKRHRQNCNLEQQRYSQGDR